MGGESYLHLLWCFIICILNKISLRCSNQKDEMDGTCYSYGSNDKFTQNFNSENRKGRDTENLNINEKKILKCILMKYGLSLRTSPWEIIAYIMAR